MSRRQDMDDQNELDSCPKTSFRDLIADIEACWDDAEQLLACKENRLKANVDKHQLDKLVIADFIGANTSLLKAINDMYKEHITKNGPNVLPALAIYKKRMEDSLVLLDGVVERMTVEYEHGASSEEPKGLSKIAPGIKGISLTRHTQAMLSSLCCKIQEDNKRTDERLELLLEKISDQQILVEQARDLNNDIQLFQRVQHRLLICDEHGQTGIRQEIQELKEMLTTAISKPASTQTATVAKESISKRFKMRDSMSKVWPLMSNGILFILMCVICDVVLVPYLNIAGVHLAALRHTMLENWAAEGY